MIQGIQMEDMKIRSWIGDVLKGLVQGRQNVSQAGKVELGAKNIKDVLVKMSEEVPSFFNSNLSSFIHLYDNENYLLRNTITEIIGNIIKLVKLIN